MNKNINILNQDSYIYEMYNEYLKNVQYYQINSKIKALSLRYYKINYAISKGIEDDLDMVNSKKFGKVYDIFDFVPVLDMQQFTYSNMNDETNQGVIRSMQGMLTIMCVEEPLPNDVFHIYSNESQVEFFQVTNVTFIQSVKNLNVYQLEFSTANLLKATVDKFAINSHFYFLREFSKFIGSSLYSDIVKLSDTRDDNVIKIKKYYNASKCFFSSPNVDESTNDIINKMILTIIENVYIPDIPPVLTVEPAAIDYKLSIDAVMLNMNDELTNIVNEMYNIYFKLWNYSVSKSDPAIVSSPIQNKSMNDYKITSVKDLDGNILK